MRDTISRFTVLLAVLSIEHAGHEFSALSPVCFPSHMRRRRGYLLPFAAAKGAVYTNIIAIACHAIIA